MCGPHFCSMKITQDVREYAAQGESLEFDGHGIIVTERLGRVREADDRN
jgi:hypothetical protein